jgi:MFS family permease
MKRILKQKHLSHKKIVTALYIASIFFALHYALVLYLSSSYLSQYFDLSFVGIVYIVAAQCSLFVTFSISRIYRVLSNYKVLLCSTIALFFVLLLLGGYVTPSKVFILFIIIIFTSLNISLAEITKRKDSGSVHGVYFTVLNTGVLVAAYLSGVIFNIASYSGIYLFSALLLIPVMYLTYRYFHSIEEPEYPKVSLRSSAMSIWKRRDLRSIVYIQFVLESLFAVMVVYMTPYLANTQGIDPSNVLRYIMPIALLPFVIFPYELGILADKKYGEKEILLTGLTFATIFTILIPFVSSSSLVIWAIILFATRVGASFIEEMASTYFYKKVKPSEVGIIAFFTVGARAIALTVVPAIAFVMFSVLNLSSGYIFIAAGMILFSGIVVASRIHDTL